MSHPIARRLAALEALAPDHGLRVVHRHEDLRSTSHERKVERRAFLSGLPAHRGLTVVIRRFFSMLEGQPVGLYARAR